MLYFFKINLLKAVLEHICSVFHLAVINPSKISVKINGTVDCVKIANLRPRSLLNTKYLQGTVLLTLAIQTDRRHRLCYSEVKA